MASLSKHSASPYCALLPTASQPVCPDYLSNRFPLFLDSLHFLPLTHISQSLPTYLSCPCLSNSKEPSLQRRGETKGFPLVSLGESLSFGAGREFSTWQAAKTTFHGDAPRNGKEEKKQKEKQMPRRDGEIQMPRHRTSANSIGAHSRLFS